MRVSDLYFYTAFRFHNFLWVLLSLTVVLAGALNAGYQDVCAKEAALQAIADMQQIPVARVSSL